MSNRISALDADASLPHPKKIQLIKPERNLLAAVLSRAICDAFGTQATDKHVIRAARRWLNEDIDEEKPFSFGYVAVHLDLDPVSLRQSIRSYAAEPETMQKCLGILK